MNRGTKAARHVFDLLDVQRTALLNGDLTQLDRLAPELETALRELSRSAPPAEQVTRLRKAAARNADLIKAAKRGVTRARETLYPKHVSQLTTYGPQGTQEPVTPRDVRVLGRR